MLAEGYDSVPMGSAPSLARHFLINVSHAYRIVYFLVPKTGSTSIRSILAQIEHSHNTHDCKGCDGYLRFSVVRNPYDRLVSLFFELRQIKDDRKQGRMFAQSGMSPDMEFTEFVKAICAIPDKTANMHHRSQWTFLPDDLDFLIRFEGLYIGWETIQSLRPRLPDLPKLRVSTHEPFTTYYTPELKQVVQHRYVEDFLRFGYVM